MPGAKLQPFYAVFDRISDHVELEFGLKIAVSY